MDAFLLYLRLEPYLAQWFNNEYNYASPIFLKKGSSEADILETFIATQRDGRKGEVRPDQANVVIALPSFRDKPPRHYNYLPPRGRAALERNIYVRFRVMLWKDLQSIEHVECPLTDRIYAWMEQHGIDRKSVV